MITILNRDVCLAEFSASAAIQAEFVDPDSYCAYRLAEAGGLARVLSRTPDPQRTALRDELEGGDEAGWCACFHRSPALQREFGDADTFLAYKRAATQGRARVLARRGGQFVTP